MSAVDPKRILLVQLHHLGDVLLATPAIRAARLRFPQARIDFLTGALGAQALAGNPHLDDIIVEPSLRSLLRAQYDAVADMHSVPRTALYTFATRARLRVGIRGRGPRNLAYTSLLPRETEPVYMALQKLRVLVPLGVDVANPSLTLEIAIDEEQRAWARAILAQLDRPVVAISPVAKHPFKQWGAHNWAVLADRLAENGASIVVTSGPGEEEQARAVADRMKHAPLWRHGETSVRQLAALYEQSSLWLGNDGGPKHIAVAAGTRTVTVNRRQHGAVWSDRNDAKQIAINSGSDSLENVQPEEVIEAGRRMLAYLSSAT
jgi:ADP-heptose:LPS heptosyltransferase